MSTQNRATPILLGILTTIMVGWVLHVSASILQPLVIALLLASMLQPVVRWLARYRIPPPVTIILLVMLLFFGIARAGILLRQAIIEFAGNLPDTTSQQVPLRLGFEEEDDDGGSEPDAESESEEDDSAEPGTEPDAEGSLDEGEAPPDGAPVEDAPTPKDPTGEAPAPSGEEPPPQESETPAATGSTGAAGPTGPESGGQDDRGPPGEGAEGAETAEGEPGASQLLGWRGFVDAIEVEMRKLSWDEKIVQYITRTLQEVDLESSAIGLLGGGFGFTRDLLLVLIYMVFIFAEQAVFRRKILSIAGRRRKDAAQVLDTIGRGIQRYLGVKTIISLATGVLCYSVLEALQVPYRLLFGFLTIFLNYIPTFGSIIAGIFPTLVALLDSPVNALIVIITYLVVNITLGSFLEPRILGRELNLSPLVIIVSVVVWAGIWGIVGTFLAVPLTAAAQIILASQESTRPIAIMLSSGPPREARRRRRRARRKKGTP